MDICEHCGRLFLTGLHALLLVELEDRWGGWQQWLCGTCLDELVVDIDRNRGSVWRLRVYEFAIDAVA